MNFAVDIIGHTDLSYRFHPSGIGEMANTSVFSALLGPNAGRVWDAYDLLGLQEYGERFHLILDVQDSITERIKQHFQTQFQPSDVSIVLSHTGTLFCLKQLGAYTRQPIISRVYAMDDFSHVSPHLHEPFALTVTQSLLASELAVEQGLAPDRILYLPYQRLPSRERDETFRYTYLQNLGLPTDAFVVGCAVRMRCGKNIEYLLDAFKSIRPQVPHAVLLIKGVLDDEWDRGMAEGYTQQLGAQLQEFRQHSWFAWDERLSPHEEQLKILQCFDASVYPTGCDDPPNVVCEQLACGTPTLLLDGGPRPSLFSDMAHFTPHQGYSRMGRCIAPYFKPEPQALAKNLLRLIRDPLPLQPAQLAQRRFGAALTHQKLPLAIGGAYHRFHNTSRAPEFRAKILAEWAADYRRFDRSMPRWLETRLLEYA